MTPGERAAGVEWDDYTTYPQQARFLSTYPLPQILQAPPPPICSTHYRYRKLLQKQFLHASNANRLEDLIKLKNINECIHWTKYYYPSTGDTALHIASRQEWTAKNCVEVCNFDGKTALHEAAQFSQPHVVRYLIKQGAEVNALKRADWTPLMLACTKMGPDALEIVNILLGNGAKPQLHNKDGWTALHIASREGDVNIVSAVLSADCSLIKLGSRNGRTPLHTAALHGQDSVVALLLKHIKDSVDISDSCGLSPLLEAVRSGNINLVQHFINSGASLNHGGTGHRYWDDSLLPTPSPVIGDGSSQNMQEDSSWTLGGAQQSNPEDRGDTGARQQEAAEDKPRRPIRPPRRLIYSPF
uniref:Uncharacterized protein n=1 Tax=Timema tahoe TaxID=61484 RepID=A0A7R9IL95_9NEOP|nr:unnamed protein product [Timema tahoe]